jgi:hypothetical protein
VNSKLTEALVLTALIGVAILILWIIEAFAPKVLGSLTGE